MNIFPPEDCFWFSYLVSKKVLVSTIFLLFINTSNLIAQSSDEIQASENTSITSYPITAERSLKRLARSFKSDAKSNFRNTLKLAGSTMIYTGLT